MSFSGQKMTEFFFLSKRTFLETFWIRNWVWVNYPKDKILFETRLIKMTRWSHWQVQKNSISKIIGYHQNVIQTKK